MSPARQRAAIGSIIAWLELVRRPGRIRRRHESETADD
jgi:hypothetical protein